MYSVYNVLTSLYWFLISITRLMNEMLLNYFQSGWASSVISRCLYWLFIYSTSRDIRYSTTLWQCLCLFHRWRHSFSLFVCVTYHFTTHWANIVIYDILVDYLCYLPSVLWCCWLGGRKSIRPVKKWMVGYWCGYLPRVRCRLAYGPADTTAIHCLLLQ